MKKVVMRVMKVVMVILRTKAELLLRHQFQVATHI